MLSSAKLINNSKELITAYEVLIYKALIVTNLVLSIMSLKQKKIYRSQKVLLEMSDIAKILGVFSY
jgi:hypothetical protein